MSRGLWRGTVVEGIDRLKPVAARGLMNGRGPQAKRSGRDERSLDREGFQACYAFRRRRVVEKVTFSTSFSFHWPAFSRPSLHPRRPEDSLERCLVPSAPFVRQRCCRRALW